jgi:3-deoxy-D-manno-octulosonic-acid transferase
VRPASLPFAARRSLAIYNVAFPLVFVALLPGLLRRLFRRGNFRENFAQRFARYDRELVERFARERPLWIHAISVGEVMLALKLARQIHALQPTLPLVVSVTTSTGYAIARREQHERLTAIYNPLDAPSIVARALRIIQPRALVFIEAMWPNLLASAKRRGLPIAMVPRLSIRSAARFRRFRWLAGPIFELIDALYLQESGDIDEWVSLGARREQLLFTGSIKFDENGSATAGTEEQRSLLARLGVAPDAPVLLGGSTFPGEERILAETFQRLRVKFPDLFLIIVPRHVERSAGILEELAPLGLRIARRSAAGADHADALLVDTTGELREWYRLATVVFIGKSLTAKGGQNPVEPVAAGKPVVFGPHMGNFRGLVAEWRRDGAAIEAADALSLEEEVARLLARPDERNAMVGKAQRVLDQHKGATERVARRVIDLLPNAS